MVVCSDCDVRVEFKLSPSVKLDESIVADERPLVGQDALKVRSENEYDASLQIAAFRARVAHQYNHDIFNTE